MTVDQKKYILVAEDDAFYANIYKVKLEKEGFEVLVVGDGQKAIDQVKERMPDLLVLDLIMPDVDGFEALERLKADDSTKNVKVIVLSNLGQDEDKEKAKKLGALEYVIKASVSIQEMLEIIRKHLK